jgi:hypothetical protein
MADQVAEAATSAGNPRGFVSAVTALGHAWKDVLFTNKEYGVLVRTAAHSSAGH